MIELKLTRQCVEDCTHSGRCDTEVEYWANHCRIRPQLNRISVFAAHQCLKEYGAWDKKELSDHAANLRRILWLAACQAKEYGRCTVYL